MCSAGYSEDVATVCVDTDGCAGYPCGAGLCTDIAAPGTGHRCGCLTGWFEQDGACLDVDGCLDNRCGHGACDDVPAPGIGYSCDCSLGYVDVNGTCIDIDGCEIYDGSCALNGTTTLSLL